MEVHHAHPAADPPVLQLHPADHDAAQLQCLDTGRGESGLSPTWDQGSMGVEVLLLGKPGTSKKPIKGFKVNEAVAKKIQSFADKHVCRSLLTLRQSTGCVVYHSDTDAPV